MKKYTVHFMNGSKKIIEAGTFEVLFREPGNLVVMFYDVTGKGSFLYQKVRSIESKK